VARQTEHGTQPGSKPSTLPAILLDLSMLPKQLLDLFEKYPSDDCFSYITKVDSSADEILIDFFINTYDSDDNGPIVQKWTIQTVGHKKNHFSIGVDSPIDIKDDHPLLWEFTDIQCELYFKGKIKNPQKLSYDLSIIHKNLFDNFQIFNITFEDKRSNFRPFQYTNGLLTKGSKKLLERYALCLKENGLDYSIIGERLLTSQTLKILFLGDSYVIAESFAFTSRD